MIPNSLLFAVPVICNHLSLFICYLKIPMLQSYEDNCFQLPGSFSAFNYSKLQYFEVEYRLKNLFLMCQCFSSFIGMDSKPNKNANKKLVQGKRFLSSLKKLV